MNSMNVMYRFGINLSSATAFRVNSIRSSKNVCDHLFSRFYSAGESSASSPGKGNAAAAGASSGIAKQLVGSDGKTLVSFSSKRTYYFTNRSTFTRFRHFVLRKWEPIFSELKRFRFYIFLAIYGALHFVVYHASRRYRYGWDYPITYYEWYKRKREGTLDPELYKREMQLERYFKKRFEENVPGGAYPH